MQLKSIKQSEVDRLDKNVPIAFSNVTGINVSVESGGRALTFFKDECRNSLSFHMGIQLS